MHFVCMSGTIIIETRRAQPTNRQADWDQRRPYPELVEVWIRRDLADAYGAVADEVVPDELVSLVGRVTHP